MDSGVAPGGGIEPPLTDSKSAVLPLDDPGMGVVPRGLFAFWPLSSPDYAPRMPRQTPRSALSGPSTVCRSSTLFQTVSGRMRREHTPHRYWSIGVGPRHSQLSARRLVQRAWLTISLVDNLAYLLPHLALSNARIHAEARLALRASLGRLDAKVTPTQVDAIRWAPASSRIMHIGCAALGCRARRDRTTQRPLMPL